MIYSITEATAPDIIREFGFDKADDYEDVQKLALDIYEDMRKYFDNLSNHYSLFKKQHIPVKDINGYIKSMDKLKKKIKSSGPKFDMSTRAINYININFTTPRDLANDIGRIIVSHGFKAMPSSGSGFKDFFKGFHMYKQISDDVIAICDMSVRYTTSYGVASNYSGLSMSITAVSTSDKNLKKLNLLKEGSIIYSLDEGNNFTAPLEDKLKEVQATRDKFISDHNKRRKEIDAALSRIRQQSRDSDIDKKQEENRKALEDLLKSFNHESCGIFFSINFI